MVNALPFSPCARLTRPAETLESKTTEGTVAPLLRCEGAAVTNLHCVVFFPDTNIPASDADSDYLFGDCSQRAVSRFGCGKSSVIKQTLEMQSEDTSATRDPLKEACSARGVWVNS